MSDETPEFAIVAAMPRNKSSAEIAAEKLKAWKKLHSVWTHHCADMPEPWYALAVVIACKKAHLEPPTEDEIANPGELIASSSWYFESDQTSMTGATEFDVCELLAIENNLPWP